MNGLGLSGAAMDLLHPSVGYPGTHQTHLSWGGESCNLILHLMLKIISYCWLISLEIESLILRKCGFNLHILTLNFGFVAARKVRPATDGDKVPAASVRVLKNNHDSIFIPLMKQTALEVSKYSEFSLSPLQRRDVKVSGRFGLKYLERKQLPVICIKLYFNSVVVVVEYYNTTYFNVL